MAIYLFTLELIIGAIVAWIVIQYEQRLNRKLYPFFWCFLVGMFLGVIERTIEQKHDLIPFVLSPKVVSESLPTK